MQQESPACHEATVRESSRYGLALSEIRQRVVRPYGRERRTECARITCHIETVYERREIKNSVGDTTLVH